MYSDSARKDVCLKSTGHGKGGGPSIMAFGGMLRREYRSGILTNGQIPRNRNIPSLRHANLDGFYVQGPWRKMIDMTCRGFISIVL